MLGRDLINIVNTWPSLKNHFDGVFAINTIPKHLKKRHFLFLNTDLNTGDGIHWQVLLRNDDNALEYFDSLGLSQTKLQSFLIYCKIKSKILKFNESPVQHQSSETCGLFCLYFIFLRLHNIDLSFDDVINEIFDKNEKINEVKVQDFLKLM